MSDLTARIERAAATPSQRTPEHCTNFLVEIAALLRDDPAAALRPAAAAVKLAAGVSGPLFSKAWTLWARAQSAVGDAAVCDLATYLHRVETVKARFGRLLKDIRRTRHPPRSAAWAELRWLEGIVLWRVGRHRRAVSGTLRAFVRSRTIACGPAPPTGSAPRSIGPPAPRRRYELISLPRCAVDGVHRLDISGAAPPQPR